jgi:hypothetical protein
MIPCRLMNADGPVYRLPDEKPKDKSSPIQNAFGFNLMDT